MNRLTAPFVQGFARLAFWRKPAGPRPEQLETTAPDELMDLNPLGGEPDADADADTDTPEPQVGRFARLKHALRWRRNAAPEHPAEPDQAAAMQPPSLEHTEASETVDETPAPRRSLLARLKNSLRRHPGAETLEVEADDSIPSLAQDDEAAASSEDDSDSDEDAVQPGRIRRMLAMLSNKWVWIPGVSVVLLALMGAMGLMLLQSSRQNEQLQAELLTTQKKLEQTGVAKKAAVRTKAPMLAGVPAFAVIDRAVADSSLGMDTGDCQVSDKESVTQNLKNCIDSFNRSMAGSRPARTTP